MTRTDRDRARARALVESLCGTPDEAADRAVQVLHAHAAALAWLRAATKTRPATAAATARLRAAAAQLRRADDERDPYLVLIRVAADAWSPRGDAS
jgi:hypothetical protein